MFTISFLVILCFEFFHIKVWPYLKKPTNGNTVILLQMYLPSIVSYHVNKIQRMKKKYNALSFFKFLKWHTQVNMCRKEKQPSFTLGDPILL